MKFVRDNLGNVYVRAYQLDGYADGQSIYELIGMIGEHGGEAWVTYTTEEEAERLDEQTDLRWMVNTNSYRAYAARHTFSRGPDEEEGRFFMDEFYGVTFAKNALILHPPQPYGKGLLQRYTIRKYHEFTYLAGMTLPVITDPEGESYVQFDMPLAYGDTIRRPRLGKGWTYTEYELDENLMVNVFGDITRLLSMHTFVGYQGPMDPREIRGKVIFKREY